MTDLSSQTRTTSYITSISSAFLNYQPQCWYNNCWSHRCSHRKEYEFLPFTSISIWTWHHI